MVYKLLVIYMENNDYKPQSLFFLLFKYFSFIFLNINIFLEQ